MVSDHQSLKWIFSQPTLNMRQRRWIELLQEFDFDIFYRPGKDNVVADSLSRKSFLNAISIPNNPIISLVKEASVKDQDYQKLLTLVQTREFSGTSLTATANFSCSNDCLYYRDRLCIPKDQSLKRTILYEAHDSPTSGHPGYAKTLNAVRKSYHWSGLKGDVLRYVRQCLSCQKIKAERVKIPGKLQPLDIPQMKWECISMDFVTGLPSTQGGYNSIMVIVDLLTKVSHLIPVKTTYTASDIARLFIKEIFRLHGLPKRIVSDRDAKFTSKFWTSLFQAVGTQLKFSTAYHPQTDGQTERVNQVLAVINALKHWKHFLYGRDFTLRTDHRALRWLQSMPGAN